MEDSRQSVIKILRRAAPSSLASRLQDGPGFATQIGGDSLTWRVVDERNDQADHWHLRYVSQSDLEADVEIRLDRSAQFAVYQVTLTNVGNATAGPLEAVLPFQLTIDSIETSPRVMSSAGGGDPGHYPPRGALWTRQELFQFPHSNRSIELSAEGDQSSIKDLPIVFVSPDIDPDAAGFIMGLEWSAGWRIQVRYVGADRVLVTDGGPLISDLTLEPGESLELPAAHLVFFQNGFEQATNTCRRYLREHIIPRHEGRQVVPPVAYTIWPGIQEPYTDSDVYPQVDTAAELGVEYFIVDDAWYEGKFPSGCGNWYADPKKFPNGLERVVEHVESKGMRFGLFIDAEAEPGTKILREHPEFFYEPELNSEEFPNSWTPHRRLYNFSLAEACDYYIKFLGDLIERYRVGYLRWDYNMDGHGIFVKVDPSLKIKFSHLKGLYRVWESLVQQHPQLMLECCAGGAGRLDLGTMKRHHTCWCSDCNSHPHVYHVMQAGGNAFFPANYLGSSLGWPMNPTLTVRDRPDMELHPDAGLTDLAFLSRMAGEPFLHGAIAEWPQEAKNRARHWIGVYKRMRHLLMLDYFRLLPQPQSEADWNAMQFSSGVREGVVFAFRWAGSTSEQPLQLRAVDREAAYRVKNEASGEEQMYTGEQLAGGFPVVLDPSSAKLFSYQMVIGS